MNEKLNNVSGGIFFSFLLIGSIFYLITNILLRNYMPYFWEGGFIITIIAPIVISIISIKELYKYFTIEKLEKDLKMED